MTYDQADKRFNIDNFIAKVTNFDFIEIFNSLQTEIRNTEQIKIQGKSNDKREVESLQERYIQNLKGLAFLLQNNGKPYGVKPEILQKFKPILEELVKKEQLPDTILELF